ncbi:tetratricopeptide repeat protein [Candidatus Magnetominusculus xianensis]|uniref:tetratricopeptide repeat protein n=1 Tax=Candidatus Magnetominusculus xianensis TaxID=1748249 RepID=UPI0012EDA3E3|nr:tetratricopeptide repeat protein [Candidatus Magnetominusculus xianensis]MBF0404643.1 tetratricopeptide repeat protein [Nitrospirota bacterium]
MKKWLSCNTRDKASARVRLYALVLLLAAIAAYSPVWNNDFVSYDDYKYTKENPYIKDGLTIESIKWAFGTFYFSNWHPITWISHMADISLYGFGSSGHHLTSLLIHAINGILLFFVLYSLTNAPGNSTGSTSTTLACVFAAALFAVHPLNVESVAWVAERKNVLCAFFWFTSLIAYDRYVRSQTLARYLIVLLLFSLALMSKPMAVTLPFTLLLIDYWPLGRFSAGHSVINKYPVTGMIAEKIPFFLLSFVSSVLTIHAQRQEGAIISFGTLPLSTRVVNAIMSYAIYIKKLFIPTNLAVFYPYIEEKSHVVIVFTALALIGLTVFVFIKRKTAPYLLMGWLWYLGTLVPVIQIVQVGSASMADRYMYIPAVGLFIMIAWGGSAVIAQARMIKVIAVVVIVLLMIITFRQTGYWRDSITLYQHAIDVTTGNYLAHNNYGQILMKQGRLDESAVQFKKGLDIMPSNNELNYNMWKVLSAKGIPDEKYLINASAIWFQGDEAVLYKNAGINYFNKAQYDDAVGFFLKSLLINKKDAEVFNYLGMALQEKGQHKEAILTFNKALGLLPNSAVLHFNKAAALVKAGDVKAAVVELKESLRLDPENKPAQQMLKEIG